jgi:hypothetical protein
MDTMDDMDGVDAAYGLGRNDIAHQFKISEFVFERITGWKPVPRRFVSPATRAMKEMGVRFPGVYTPGY